jgi:hypothetical protein
MKVKVEYTVEDMMTLAAVDVEKTFPAIEGHTWIVTESYGRASAEMTKIDAEQGGDESVAEGSK